MYVWFCGGAGAEKHPSHASGALRRHAEKREQYASITSIIYEIIIVADITNIANFPAIVKKCA